MAQIVPQEFVITRTFNAPKEKVWRAFTEAEHLKHWWGPKGFTMNITRLDFQPEGIFHYGVLAPDGKEMWGKFMYKDILPMEKIVFINSFSNPEGGITRHPMSATWPLEVFNIVTFEEEDGKTIITLKGYAINATDEERRTFDENHLSIQQDFEGAWQQLEDYLTTL